MNYQTKKDVWVAILLFGITGFIVTYSFIQSDLFFMIIGVTLLIAIIWFWFTVRYKVDEGQLMIKFGPFTKKIDILDIEQIRLVRSLKLSPALSVTRLEITYGYDHRVIRISPADKSLFVKQLMSINPDIEFE
ncbi:PH domain-containing protein [Alkalibacillus haloalkaliphilus]|uniref:PH domain-containing protein n=1 Tax=Alkalibacillus haloalkaliphilus TaxID=94136 RepID=UPI0002E91C49|nr:PH domain-containing protein [Alkalibacillus haloalkaliphilus]